jgi:hypothetical protein
MGFRIQRRLNVTRGMGLNISKSGISPSLRNGFGSIGPKGFSIRTGIPGLNFRSGFGKNSGGAGVILMIMVALIPLFVNLLFVVAQVAFILAIWGVRIFIIAPYNMACWAVQTLIDYVAYRRSLKNNDHPS